MSIPATPPSYEAALNHAVYFDLSSCGKVQITGRDAVKFLHNQCTNDIANLPVGGGCEAFLCNPRARTIAYFLVSKLSATDLLLDAMPGLNEKIIKHLDKFLISEQVELNDVTKTIGMVRLAGPDAGNIAAELLASPLPELANLHHVAKDVPALGKCYVRRQQVLGVPGFDVFYPAENAAILLGKLQASGLQSATPEVHEILRIEAGTPEYGKDIDDERFVVEVGRTAQAICYTKGCFQGQEPIVMARDRGQVNRMLMKIKVPDGAVPLAHGTRLFHGDAEVGLVTSSVFSPRFQQVIGLAYIRRGHQQPGTELVIEPVGEGRKATVVS